METTIERAATAQPPRSRATASDTEFDVLIVGAGLSGVGAAYHLRERCPSARFAILEGRATMGGTWDLFRYPGIRSDSDMFTLGYSFRPWHSDKAISDGQTILDYIQDTARVFGIDKTIRYQHKVTGASWDSAAAHWTVRVQRTNGDRQEELHYTCKFLYMCSGYYDYEEGHAPTWAQMEQFQGRIVHPQHWPEDLDYAGKRVVVIGSGATAVTLVPAMAETAQHVTMLQRSPTYIVSRPEQDAVANTLRRWLPAGLAHRLVRTKNVLLTMYFYGLARRKPKAVKDFIIRMAGKQIGPDFDVRQHLTPRYNPWDQRLCLIPNSDLFEALRIGRASMVTDLIDTFTEKGIRLQTGAELEADIIVTATGLNLAILGESQIAVDGEVVDFSKKWSYKGLMYSDVPNLVATFGYINASWTLRADLTAEYACRLLNHMAARGSKQVTPRLRPTDANMVARPWIDGFSSGYVRRAMRQFPRQGDREPWVNPQNYQRDKAMIRDRKSVV